MSKTLLFDGTLIDFDNLESTIANLDIECCIQSMSKVCRFNGNTRFFYSNLQHCINVSNICPTELKLAGLLHDIHEAIIGDIVTPVANHLGPEWKGQLTQLKNDLDSILADKWNCPELVICKPEIKVFDDLMCDVEAHQLICNSELLFTPPRDDLRSYPIYKLRKRIVRKYFRQIYKELKAANWKRFLSSLDLD